MSSSSPPAVNATAAASARVARAETEVRANCATLLALIDESRSWKVLEDSKGLRIVHKEAVGDVHAVFLGQGIVDAPLAVCLELLMDTLKKPLIDSVFDKAVLIEDLTDSIKVERHLYWAPPFITKRDMCVLLNKARLDDGTVVLTAKSTKHSQCPEDPKFLRALLHCGGWFLRSVDDPSRTELTLVGSSDLRGSLPAAIKHLLTAKQPGQIANVKPLLAKRLDELSKMTPEARAAQMSKLQALVDSLPCYSDGDLKLAAEDARAAEEAAAAGY